ncbi:hypothetical protein [Corynebacterium glaucum]|uniref:hypothetical protein n=1 Tax=Corynebacterium glaucum TaxID=187491 RepID=UPI00265A772B|nr:hypothetical protein [Corynebacterium glaucum]
MAGSWHLAVDFGTSNSAAAQTNPFGGAVEAVALSYSSNLMLSAVILYTDGMQRNNLTARYPTQQTGHG